MLFQTLWFFLRGWAVGSGGPGPTSDTQTLWRKSRPVICPALCRGTTSGGSRQSKAYQHLLTFHCNPCSGVLLLSVIHRPNVTYRQSSTQPTLCLPGSEAGLILTWRSLAVSLRSAPVPDGTSLGLGEPPSWLQNDTMDLAH
ncbi:unnamed protein product [Arctogadus glacialis]